MKKTITVLLGLMTIISFELKSQNTITAGTLPHTTNYDFLLDCCTDSFAMRAISNDTIFWYENNFYIHSLSTPFATTVTPIYITVNDSSGKLKSIPYSIFKASLGIPSAISLTTTGGGTGVASTYNSSTGAFNIPAAKRIETYSGTTNGSGNYTVTFATSYSVAPNVQVTIPNQSSTNQYCRVTSVSTTGFTVNAYSFTTNTVLGIVNLTNTVSNITSLSVDVLVTEK